jgi:hypothetical protein
VTGPSADARRPISPEIDGLLVMHKADESGEIHGDPARHNELLGGHGDDIVHAGIAGDVLWGDYKPSGQPVTELASSSAARARTSSTPGMAGT